MHRIDGPGHVGGAFVSEDLALGRAPTVVTPEWLNAVQSELLQAAALAGLQPDKGDNGQLARAIKQSIGNTQKVMSIFSSTTLLASDVGSYVVCGGASSFAVTLPPTSGVADGATFYIQVTGTGLISVTAAGTDRITYAGEASLVKNIDGGQYLMLVASGGYWFASGASALASTRSFRALLESSGYQMLPSGLIIQWVVDTISRPANVSVPFSWPIAFTNQLYLAISGPRSSSVNPGAYSSISSESLSGATVLVRNDLSQGWWALGIGK